ncbi:MAG: protoporphyrinogen oxidase [Dehalococcoidia bacterium]
MSTTVSVAVVGGGVAGLATAYYLERHALRNGWPLRGWLIEAEGRLGGKVFTQRDGPFVVEAGPDSFITQKPWAVELAREVGLGDALIPPRERRVFVLYRGRLHPVPESLLGLAPANLWALWRAPFLSPLAKARASLEPLIPPRRETADEPLGAFLRRRLGREWAERLGEPLMAGIHAGDPQRLSLLALYPTLAHLERQYGSLARALRQARATSPHGERPSPFLGLAGGMDALPEAVARRLALFQVLLRRRVEALSPTAGGFALVLDDGAVLHAQSVVLAVPAFVSARLVEGFAPRAAGLLARLEYATTVSVTLALRRQVVAHPLEGSGFLVPRTEPFPIAACSWITSKWPGRAPEGFVLLRAFLGWARDASPLTWDDREIVRRTMEALRPLLRIQGKAERAWVHRWPRALPQYAVGHLGWLTQVDEALAHCPGLLLVGSAYRGVGIPDCVRQGQAAAERLAGFLRLPSRQTLLWTVTQQSRKP